jgi:pyruvate kinase
MSLRRAGGRRTKIVATIGPASATVPVIERLLRAGLDVVRLNLSHGSQREHAAAVRDLRRVAQRLDVSVGLLVDLPGPKYRTGKLSTDSVTLKRGATVVLTTESIVGDASRFSVSLPELPQDVKRGNTILINDGRIQLVVSSKRGREVTCQVTVGGELTQGRGLVVPGLKSRHPFVSPELRENLDFALRQRPDYIALSFVSSAADVNRVRKLIQAQGADVPLISKIERGQAVKNFDEILAASDGVMVARGDLGVDIPLERLPLVQKDIIRRCNQAGKPVITATEMLESMITSVRPTRAEVSDVANAILDGTDATMLSAETSVGKYPVQAVRTMAKVARETEAALPYDAQLRARGAWLEHTTDELISYNAVHTAQTLGAAAIVAFSQSGVTAGRVAKYRPRVPILAITPHPEVVTRLKLRWGVTGALIQTPESVAALFETGVNLARQHGLARSGDLLVITGGLPIGVAGSTNLLKVERVP